MEIKKGIQIMDLALFMQKERILVLGDIHIGYEEALNKQGILVPRFQFKDLIDRLTKIINETKPKTVLIIGDLKHEFGTISDQEWRETLKFLDFLGDHTEKIILVKGNHDTILGPIAKKRNVEIVDDYIVDNIAFVHGHKLREFAEEIDTIVIGHEHPAITIREGMRYETFKCFLSGKYGEKTLIVLPSLFLMTEGTDILREEMLSPFLQQDLDGFHVFIVDDNGEVHDFGTVNNIKKLNRSSST
jgi:putative SbcD/Mre11-related phosphoesterase